MEVLVKSSQDSVPSELGTYGVDGIPVSPQQPSSLG